MAGLVALALTAGQDEVQRVFSLTGSVSYHREPNELAQTRPAKPAVRHKHTHSKVHMHATLKKRHTPSP